MIDGWLWLKRIGSKGMEVSTSSSGSKCVLCNVTVCYVTHFSKKVNKDIIDYDVVKKLLSLQPMRNMVCLISSKSG